MKTVKVRITKEDIKNGTPTYGDKCPIALAVHRATGRNDIIINGLKMFAGNPDKPTMQYPMSIRAQICVFLYDAFKRMPEFSVDVPAAWFKQEPKSAIIAQGEWPIDLHIKKLKLVTCEEEAICA